MSKQLPSLEEAIQQQDDARAALQAASTPAKGLAAQCLPPFKSRPIKVKLVQRDTLKNIIGQPADATVMLDGDTYFIFLADPPSQTPFAISDEEAARYYVCHEYEHIVNGHAFHDDPVAVYNSIIKGHAAEAEQAITINGARRYIDDATRRGATEHASAVAEYFNL
jgi:hypothetical protein